MTDFNAMIDALVSCDTGKVTGLVNDALAQNITASDILNNGLIAGNWSTRGGDYNTIDSV